MVYWCGFSRKLHMNRIMVIDIITCHPIKFREAWLKPRLLENAGADWPAVFHMKINIFHCTIKFIEKFTYKNNHN